MPVYLDDEIIEVPTGGVGSALDTAVARLTDRGRVVIEVRLDGRELVGSELEQVRDVHLDDSELHLYSADSCDLAVTLLEQSLSKLEEAQIAQSKAAEHLQQDHEDQAMREVSTAIEIWINVHQAVSQTVQLFKISLDEMIVDGQPVSHLTQNTLDQLKQLRDLILAKDTIGIADALGYEWPDCVKQWTRLIHELIDRIKSDNP